MHDWPPLPHYTPPNPVNPFPPVIIPNSEMIPRSRKPMATKNQKTRLVLDQCITLKLSPITFILTLMDRQNKDFAQSRRNIYEKPEDVHALLDLMYGDVEGRAILEPWMREHTLDLVCKDMQRELESSKKQVQKQPLDITIDFLSKWDPKNLVNDNGIPTVTRVLTAMLQKKGADSGNLARQELVS